MPFYKFQKAKNNYFSKNGSLLNILVNNTDVNLIAPEMQLGMLEFEDALQRCRDCSKSWFIRDSLDFWYPHFRTWLDDGGCEIAPNGLDPFLKVLDPPVFRSCLRQWTSDDYLGRSFREHLKYSQEDGALTSFKMRILMAKLDSFAVEGVKLLKDLYRIEEKYGLKDTSSYQKEFINIEPYFDYVDEQIVSVLLSLIAVIAVVFFVTVNLQVTLLVVFSVVLVDVYLVALIYYWGLTLNTYTGANMIFALGMAVDYSTHIAHAYLMAEPPETCVSNQ